MNFISRPSQHPCTVGPLSTPTNYGKGKTAPSLTISRYLVDSQFFRALIAAYYVLSEVITHERGRYLFAVRCHGVLISYQGAKERGIRRTITSLSGHSNRNKGVRTVSHRIRTEASPQSEHGGVSEPSTSGSSATSSLGDFPEPHWLPRRLRNRLWLQLIFSTASCLRRAAWPVTIAALLSEVLVFVVHRVSHR